MTTTVNNNAPIISALSGLVSADRLYMNAAESLALAVKTAADLGIKSGDLDGKPKGKWFVETQALLAIDRFTAEEFTLWNDATVKQAKGNAKQGLAMRLNSIIGRIRARLHAAEVASVIDPAPVAAAAKGAKGAKGGTIKTFDDLCLSELQSAFTRSYKRETEEPAAIDYAAFRTHLIAAADVFGKPLKVPAAK